MRFDVVLGHLIVRLIRRYLPHNDIGTCLSKKKNVFTFSTSYARYRFKYPGIKLKLAFENVFETTASRRNWLLNRVKVCVPKGFNAFVSHGTYTLTRLREGESILYLQASLAVSTTESQCRVCLQHATVLLCCSLVGSV